MVNIEPRLLEVIVTSADEALEAQEAGADRLELVRNLDLGGLSPSLEVTERVVSRVSIPVRVMLRQSSTMSVADGGELSKLLSAATALAPLPLHGVVAGFVSDGEIDLQILNKVAEASQHSITFHRAFEELRHPERQIEVLATLDKVDRILVRAGGKFSLAAISRLQAIAGHRIKFITGIGLNAGLLKQFGEFSNLREIHAGRAVREPEATDGKISRLKIAALKKALS